MDASASLSTACVACVLSTTPADLRRFLAYDALLHERDGRSIRIVIFYSNGITTAQAGINAGAILCRVDNVFFADYDADVRFKALKLFD